MCLPQLPPDSPPLSPRGFSQPWGATIPLSRDPPDANEQYDSFSFSDTPLPPPVLHFPPHRAFFPLRCFFRESLQKVLFHPYVRAASIVLSAIRSRRCIFPLGLPFLLVFLFFSKLKLMSTTDSSVHVCQSTIRHQWRQDTFPSRSIFLSLPRSYVRPFSS